MTFQDPNVVQSEIPEIEYVVAMPQPWTHYFEVTVTVIGLPQETADFVMPVWTPGSYLVREFARHVHDFRAADSSGKTIPAEKINKNTWRVHANKASKLVVQYRVYAFEVSVRTSFLDDSHGYINGASVFMYVDGFQKAPYRIRIEPYPGWERVSTGLEPVPGQQRTFLASNFDIVVDNPFEIGNQKILDFVARNIPHSISIYGEGNYDPEKMRTDMRKIVEAAAEIFDDIPYRNYTFLIQLLPEGGTGLEHLNSTSLIVSRWSFGEKESYRRFLSLVAHEFFHVWNVKRIRPEALGPFDYTKENYTRMLWVSEGFTEYYAFQILRRAGLETPDQTLERLSREIQSYKETPGRLVESAAEASFDAWIKHYRRDENSDNITISYYQKGELIGLVLDLEIRRRAAGARSLDDVLRFLYNEYYKKQQRGFTDREFRAACERAAGESLSEIFDNYAYGTSEIDFARFLNYAGLGFAELKKEEKQSPKGFLGIKTKVAEGKVLVADVSANTPAYEHRLNVNDEILAVDGFRINQESLTSRIEEKRPGERVEITVSRAGKLRAIPVVLGEKRPEFKIVRLAEPTSQQKQLYETWLRASWDPPGKVAANEN